MKKTKFFGLLSQIVSFSVCFAVFASSGIAQANCEWWNDDKITARGYGIKSAAGTNLKKEALEDARAKLIKKITGIRITAGETISEADAAAVVESAKVVKEQKDGNGSVGLILGVDIYGKKSLANVALPKTNKARAGSSVPAAGKAQGDYTALVIDCTKWENANAVYLKPVMIPEIKDETGRVIYSGGYIDRETAVKKGYVQYAPNEKFSDAGERPLIVSVTDIADELGNPIVSAEDAKKIILENRAAHFLDKANVIILSNSVNVKSKDERGMRVWGVRDSYRPTPHGSANTLGARDSGDNKNYRIHGARA